MVSFSKEQPRGVTGQIYVIALIVKGRILAECSLYIGQAESLRKENNGGYKIWSVEDRVREHFRNAYILPEGSDEYYTYFYTVIREVGVRIRGNGRDCFMYKALFTGSTKNELDYLESTAIEVGRTLYSDAPDGGPVGLNSVNGPNHIAARTSVLSERVKLHLRDRINRVDDWMPIPEDGKMV
jgi:hypothetical protein